MGHGRGGHFHSLNHISRNIGNELPIYIATIGPGNSDVIQNNPFFLNHIYFNGLNILSLKRELEKILKDVKPDILHCFDVYSYDVIRPFVNGQKFKFVVNKCGGPNPKSFTKVDHLILFSIENKLWFDNEKKFQNTSIYVIPNRANRILTGNFKEIPKDENVFNFVRIARIGKSYVKGIRDTINLLNVLKDRYELNIKFYIIGTVQDDNIFRELLIETENQKHIIFITEHKYTAEASKMLYLADAVVGTGRGVMEASSLGIPVLNPVKNSNMPVLITARNFNSFFTTNFSERSVATNEDLTSNIELIYKMVSNQKNYEEHKIFSNHIFEKYFDVANVFEKYFSVYQDAMNQEQKSFRLNDIAEKLKSFYVFYRKSTR